MAHRQHYSVWEDMNKNDLEVIQQNSNVRGLGTLCSICISSLNMQKVVYN